MECGKIIFLRNDGTKSRYLVVAGGFDRKTKEIIFHELIGLSSDIRNGTGINGRKTYKRLLIQKVYPAMLKQ